MAHDHSSETQTLLLALPTTGPASDLHFAHGLDEISAMRDTVEQSRSHLRNAEHRGPLAEGEVGYDDDAGALYNLLIRWGSNCPPEHANGGNPAHRALTDRAGESCPAMVPPLPIQVSSSMRVTTHSRS